MSPHRLQPIDYTVGWICALPIELAAAQVMLDEKHEGPIDSSDSNIYTLGRVCSHNVVIACLPAGQTGTQSAAIVATCMRAKFPSVLFCLMVGIGSGVPSDEVDIRLGDVVISQHDLQHGGVVHYSFGKTVAGGEKIRTRWFNELPEILLSTTSELQARHYQSQSHLASYLSAFSQLEDFRRHDVESDILFKANYTHVGEATCNQCNKEYQIKRTPRKNQDVVVHYGTIASGNQVIKDGVTRDEVSLELGGIKCFEMEAAGLLNSFPYLVIRGICDYADSHEYKAWQPYAAATAAACAKEILAILPRNESDHQQKTPETHFLVPFSRNNHFVPVSHFDLLKKKLFTEKCQEIAIYGLGGVGKTQLVLELAYQIREQQPSYSVFWIQASSIEKVEQAYLQIGQSMQIPGIDAEDANAKQLVRQKLSQESTGHWLLILDNADDADMWFNKVDTGATQDRNLI